MDQTTPTAAAAPTAPPPRSCLQNGLWGLLNGVGLILIAFCLLCLFYNEVSLQGVAKGLTEARKEVVSIIPNVLDPQNEGKMVHLAGMLEVGAPLRDPEFGVEVRALRLTRELEMYQWAEVSYSERRTEGGQTRDYVLYRYEKRWANRLVDASKFQEPAGHGNPKSMPGLAEPKWMRLNDQVKLGAFQVPPDLVKKVVGDNLLYQENANPPQDVPLPTYAERGLAGQRMPGGDPGWMYFGRDVQAPELGDIRVRYRFVPAKEVTIVAQQAGDRLEAYTMKSGTKVHVLRNGIANAEDALQEELLVNHLGSWFIRIVLGLVLAGALAMSANAWRRVGGVRTAASVSWWIFGLLGAAGLCFVVIGLSWLMVRPLTGIGLVVLGAVILSGLHRLGARGRAAG